MNEFSGGMSGINRAVHDQLKRYHNISDYCLIDPEIDLLAKIRSKALRMLGFKANYHFFSNKRLQIIANQIETLNTSSEAMFFMGFTQWIRSKPNCPYYCYNDACFGTYVEYYNNKSEFKERDLERIFNLEKKWLEGAEIVFFNSQWALEETKRLYGMRGDNFVNAGVGGFISIPERDFYESGYNFLFISREFIPKGGLIVLEAFKKVKEIEPSAELWIAGEVPPQSIELSDGVHYKGFFDKTIPEQKHQLEALFKRSFALVHPTLKDTTTLVISELAYYGCPAISSNRFAIPEFVKPDKTGLLLEDPESPEEVAACMIKLIQNVDYPVMRRETRKNILNNHTWDMVGDRIHHAINR